jgi:uncharacterized membrane protein
VAFFVIPGYVLMLVTGLWMVNLSWHLRIPWIKTALVLWGVGFVPLAIFLAALTRQLRLLENGDASSTTYRRISLIGRALGAGGGLVVIVILYLMVFKPGS